MDEKKITIEQFVPKEASEADFAAFVALENLFRLKLIRTTHHIQLNIERVS